MSPDWATFRVDELQRAGRLLVEDGNHGEYRPRPDEFGSDGAAFIRATDMSRGRVLFESAEHINEVAVRRIRKGIGRGGDILFSHKGTVGKLALVPIDAPPFVCSPQTTFWRTLDESRLDRRFLYYFMSSRGFTEQWHSRKGETDMADYVSLTAQRKFRLSVPPIEEQRAIARVLGVLDDKIELNRQMNRALEEASRALFRSWFVGFEPTLARVDRRHPKGLTRNVASLFPEHFVDSVVGPIPEGWNVAKIGDVVRVLGGSTPRTDEPQFWAGGDIPWATPKDLSRLSNPVLLDTERKITAEGLSQISSGLLPVGTVLLSSRAPIGYLVMTEVPVAVNQGFIAMVCSGELSNHYVLRWTEENLNEVLARAGGTTFAEISKSNFRPIPVIIPGRAILDEFDALAAALHRRLASNLRESETLAALRDALLPKLLSGQVQIAPVEKLVEQAI